MSGAVIVRLVCLLFISQYFSSNGSVIDVSKEDIEETRKLWTEYKKLSSTPVAISSLFAKLLPANALLETGFRDELIAMLGKNSNNTVLDGSQLLIIWIDKIMEDLDNDKELQRDIDDMKLRQKNLNSGKAKNINVEIAKLLKRDLGSRFDATAQKSVDRTVLALINAVSGTS
ncbi:uncharacterized protein [Anabrus simplex]|uniref:uncharacterized protein n=1 Tax=Anabrus simplex TaxID=316456 RepID=UPI0034DCCBDF